MPPPAQYPGSKCLFITCWPYTTSACHILKTLLIRDRTCIVVHAYIGSMLWVCRKSLHCYYCMEKDLESGLLLVVTILM